MTIEERERLDFEALRQFKERYGKKETELHKMPQYSKYDAFTSKDQHTIAVIELKTREKYSINDFSTFLLSLHKVDELQEAKRLENAQKCVLMAFYPKDDRTVYFDVTGLTANNCDITWKKTWKTHYDKKQMQPQPYAVLSLNPGKYKHYETIIFQQDLDFLLENGE